MSALSQLSYWACRVMTNRGPVLVAKDISFNTGDGFVLRNISASFGAERIGLVGKNGIGKTTLLRLLVGELKPTRGKIERIARVAYLPQHHKLDLSQRVSAIVGAKGPEKFGQFGLKNIKVDRVLGSLSGGERMKVMLAGLLASNPDFLVFDEPTNDLDSASREAIYNLVNRWKGGMLVVSHDRKLLRLMDRILELSEQGLKAYGGNYDVYKEQKDIENAAAARNLVHAREGLKTAGTQAQTTEERQRERLKRGKERREKIGMSRLELGHMKETSENTTARLRKVHIQRVKNAKRALEEARVKIPPENNIKVDLSSTEVPTGKLVAALKKIKFSYPGSEPLFDNFSFEMYGPMRIAVKGPNGSGKTTFVKLILKELEPVAGETILGAQRIAYLDQNVAKLREEDTLLENAKRISGLEDEAARKWLARFLFKDAEVFKKVEVLSGGERMRAALACILAGDKPPQLLVLDEPTNNLDLSSIERIESALMNYRGALIVISHDEDFVRNIGVEEEIELG